MKTYVQSLLLFKKYLVSSMKIFPKVYGQVLIFFNILFTLCVHPNACVCVYMTTCYTHGEKPCESVLSFYHAGPGD